MSSRSSKKALACVMGDMDLVRPLGLSGIPCAVVAQPGSSSFYSRFTRASLYWEDWENFEESAEELVEMLVRFGAAQPEPPVLFYMDDSQLLFVSRYRDRLARNLRFVVANSVLVEDLVDKTRFQGLAERLDLPVPRTLRLRPAAGSQPTDLDLRFPVIMKPLRRRTPWESIAGANKALQIDTPDALRELWPQLVAVGMDILVQELIPGPESCIESYHVYVDQQGNIIGEFTGQKIRTRPASYGHSTSLVVTDTPDVRTQGRALVETLGLVGVAKFDFKRGPDGTLHLLEVNPRFNLWHHLGAIAGVNLPALVYADLVGLPRPAAPPLARAGVRWCRLWDDGPAAIEGGIPFATWLPWALRCEAKSAVAWDDPIPSLREVWSQLSPRRALRFLRRTLSERGKCKAQPTGALS